MSQAAIPLVPPIKINDVIVELIDQLLTLDFYPVGERSRVLLLVPTIKEMMMKKDSIYNAMFAAAMRKGIDMALQLAAERAELAICTKEGIVLANSYSSYRSPGSHAMEVSISIDKQSILDIKKLFV